MSELKSAAISGVKWNVICRAYSALVKVLQAAILTRFIAKEDFGLMGVAILVNTFCLAFSDLGLSVAAMHQKELTREQFSSFYWMNLAMGLLLSALSYGFSPLVASYYKQPELIGVISITCVMLFTDSVSALQRTIQQKNLNFKFMSVVDMLSSTIMLVSNIIFAVNGYGVFSMVYSSLLGSSFRALVYLYAGIFIEHNICFHFRFSEVRKPLKIGSFVVGSKIMDFFSGEMDSIIISSGFTMEMFGVYTLCKSLANRIFAFVNPIVNNVLTPVMANIQGEKEKMTAYYFKCIDLLSAINLPIYSIVAFLSYSIMTILYGASYADYSFALFCLSYYFAISASNDPVGALYVSTGRTDLGMYWTIFRIVFSALYYYMISSLSLNMFVIGMALLPLITSYPFWRIVFGKLTTISFPAFFMVPIKPLLCCIPMFPVYLLDKHFNNPFLSIIILTPIIIAGYTILTYLFRRQFYGVLVSTVMQSIKHKK